MEAKEIKQKARVIIESKKLKFILFTLCIGMILFVTGVILGYILVLCKFNYYAMVILMCILISIMIMVTAGSYLNFERCNKFNLYSILKKWKVCLKYFIFNIVILLIIKILTFVFVSAFMIFGSALIFSALSKYWIDLLITGLSLIISIYIGIILGLTYFPVIYLLFDGYTLRESAKKSKKLMNGNKKRLFILKFSFIEWFVLGILTLGIVFLIVIPYYNISLIIFYNGLIDGNEEKLIKIKE